MKREIKSYPAAVEAVPADEVGDVKDWLQTQAATLKLKWLLAHADDGVIWGRLDTNGQLVTSHEAARGDQEAEKVCPPLRAETLQQARLFSADAELLLWRGGDNQWHARLIRTPAARETPTLTDAIDEPQMLWGTYSRLLDQGFTLMSDGAQGLRHVVPMIVSGNFDERTRPLRLLVRHYLDEDDGGFNRIVASRLVDLKVEGAQ
jgi:CRISPR-associated protein (TIGR03984 family)